jgi:hypothetical protein
MRRMFYGLVGASLLAMPCAQAAQCSTQADQTVFDLQALKSALMVLTTGCPGNDSDYNAFVMKYKPELGYNEKALTAYFKRAFGRNGQREQDSYVTSLANAQSQEGMHLGSDFCPRTVGLFHEVMALRDGRDLDDYAAGKDLIPDQVGSCVGLTATPAVAHTRATSSHSKKH